MPAPENRSTTTHLGYLAIARVVIGGFFFDFGWQKLTPRFLSGQQLAAQFSRVASDPLSWHREFILHTVVPHAHFFGYLIAWGELALGISLILGFMVRLTSIFGIFHNINILLAIAIPSGGPQIGLNRIFIVMQLMFLFSSAGRALGIDGILKNRFPRSWII